MLFWVFGIIICLMAIALISQCDISPAIVGANLVLKQNFRKEDFFLPGTDERNSRELLKVL